MKKVIIAAVMATIFMAGCQQVQEAQTNVTKTIGDAAQQVESARSQAIDMKNKIDEKVTQAKEAADAVGRLAQ
jgi:PBP1b-binding outer membrane lipoprotein LpoB